MDPKFSEQASKALRNYKKPFNNIYEIYRYKLGLMDQDPSFHKRVASLRKQFHCDDLTCEEDWRGPYDSEAPSHFVFCSLHFHEMSLKEKAAFNRSICEMLIQYGLSPVHFNSFAHLILYGDRRVLEGEVDSYELDLGATVIAHLDLIHLFKLTTFEKRFIKKSLRFFFEIPEKGRPTKALQKTESWRIYKEVSKLLSKSENLERKKNEATIKAAFSKASSDMDRAESFRSIPTDEFGDEIAKKAANRIRQARFRTKKYIRFKREK